MADNTIELIAKLNTKDSVKVIKENLATITNELNKNPIEIQCRISKSCINDIQNQLGKITKSINVNVNANSIQQGIEANKTNLTQQAKEIEKALGLEYPRGRTEELRSELKKLLSDYQQAYDIESGLGEQAQKNMTELIRFANNYRKEISLTNEELKFTQDRIKEIKAEQQQVFITANQYNALDKDARNNGTTAKFVLDQALGAGRWSANANTYKYNDKPYYWSNFAEEVNQINPLRDAIIDEGDIIQGVRNLAEFMEKSFTAVNDSLEKNEEAYLKWGQTVIETINSVTGRDPFADQWETFDPDSIEETVQEVQRLTTATEAAAQAAKKIEYPEALDIQNNTDEILANAKKVITEGLAQNAETAGDKVTRVTKAVEDAEGRLQSFIVQVEKENKSIETLTYALNEEGEAYEYLGKTIREADNSTDLRRKDLSTQWDMQAEKLIQFANNADKAGFASNELKEDLQKLFASLNKANPAFGSDTSAMNAFLDDFDIAKAKLQAFNAEVRKDTALTNFNNKIKKLSADMNEYAAANQRAIESNKKMSNGRTFAEEWVRLTELMAKGINLTDKELRNLIADFAVFKKESKTVGLEGASAFEKFANSFKVISTYISANQIINRVISQIRSAVSELQTLDDRLTEISKTSDRTEESLRRLGESSFQTASQYGRTASDYLLGVQEMSRAGFGEKQSEQLAELSILAQAAGDMTAEMANQYIIATNAAYGLEGNERKLNKVLDSQNYITNHNAVNMEHLTTATKLAASQAAASGVAIDELTAAVGTMVAVTQQGGDQAGRAFKGILMNIQQVKASAADIGDGGADITAESLSKYEKASAALGVSLKEVKNGTLQLREPMEVLRDLAQAVSKESEESIKVANLVSAVGGKFRGNQLIALLKNWETYEKMLSEYNSEEAIDSAMEEAKKSANNWAGSINKVKNSWSELVSQFANSENMKSMLKSINEIIKSITDSAATGGLSAVSNGLTDILRLVSTIVQKLGALPTILTSIAVAQSIKGKGIFNGQTLDELKNKFQGANTSLGNYIKGLVAAKAQTIALKVASVALETAISAGVTLAISVAVEALSKFIDNIVITKEELDDLRSETSVALESLKSNTEAFNEETKSIANLVAEYKTIIDTSRNVESAKDDLLKIQQSLIDKFGDEAEGLDLVNGKYDENIKKIKEYSEEQRKAFELENAADILRAKRINELNVQEGVNSTQGSGIRWSSTYTDTQGRQQKEFEVTDDLTKELFLIEDVNAELRRLAENYDNIYTVRRDTFKNKDAIVLGGDIKEAISSLETLIDKYDDLDSADEKTLKALSDRLKLLKKEAADIDYFLANEPTENTLFENIFKVATDKFDEFTSATKVSAEKMKEEWLNALDDMQKGALKNISTMVSALQDLSEGKGIAANTFWQLIEFDEEGLLNGAKLVGDKFYIAEENMIKLKDKYIQKQIESIKLSQKDNEEKYRSYLLDVQTYEQKLRELPLTDKMYNTAAYQRINQQLETARANAKAYGDAIERDRWLIEYLNQTLGNTVDLQKQLEAQQKQLNKELTALNKELDNYQKAYEAKIDGIIKGLEAEEDQLEKELDVLEDELDVLEKQRDTIEETLDNYEKVNSYVQKIIDKEIESLEEQRDAIKNTYDERINKLKEENEEREDALDYAQKLANLENAQNNKRRVYDEARGWRYESVKEDVVKAESDLRTFETNQEIKKLEKERDAEIKAWDALIKQKEDYKKQWAEWLEEIQLEESEALAQEILGAEWREKIANGDLSLIETFSSQYRIHNAELKRLTDTEIKLKKAEIDAKNEDIKASKERITAWKNYKQEFSTAVTDIKQANEDYMKQIGDIQLSEASTLEERANAFETFKDRVSGLVDQIGQKQGALDNVTASLEELQDKNIQISFEIEGMDLIREARDALNEINANSEKIKVLTAAEIFKIMADNGISDAPQGEQMAALIRYLEGYSSGGVADYTGIAMLHGRKSAPETIFNASDSAKLYDMVHNTPNLMADMLNQATKLSGFKLASNEVSNNSNVSFYIDKIVTDNPVDFERQLDKYYRTKLTQSYTGRN